MDIVQHGEEAYASGEGAILVSTEAELKGPVRVQLIDSKYVDVWELPVIGTVAAPTAVLIRPDGYVAWVGDGTCLGLYEALTTWFGPPAAA